jgi:hypothetical protein
MLTAGEAKQEAAWLLSILMIRGLPTMEEWALGGPDSWPLIERELDLILWMLLKQLTGGDKILARQLGKELGRQVRPTAKQAKQLGIGEPKA